MDPNSWLYASGERPHLLPRVEQSYIYEPQIPGPSTASQEAWIAGHLGQAGPPGVRISPPSDLSMSMSLRSPPPAAEERPIAPAPTHTYQPHSDTYEAHSSSTESLDSMDDDSLSDDEEYQRYEKLALEELERRRGGSLMSSNPRMRREVTGTNTSTSSDDTASSTDADCPTPRPVSDADVTSSANVTRSADVNSSANAASHTSSADAAGCANVSSSADVATSPHADTYRRKRDRNNNAAKQSRDKRRLRETKLKIREAFLKMKLREDMQLYETVQYQRNLTARRFEL